VVTWLDTDQHDRLKLASIMRLAWNGYSQFTQLLAGKSRAEYFAETGWSPITTYFAVEATEQATFLDAAVDVHYDDTLGAVGGRFGGVDQITLRVNDQKVASVRHHWLWFNVSTSSLLTGPAPLTKVDQGAELPKPPRPPDRAGALPAGSFRWTTRETDRNQHVNAAAYIERAENAVADAGADSVPHHRADIWFRRPTFRGDQMNALVRGMDTNVLVDLVAAGSGESCSTLLLS
jgi:hypothetical protein